MSGNMNFSNGNMNWRSQSGTSQQDRNRSRHNNTDTTNLGQSGAQLRAPDNQPRYSSSPNTSFGSASGDNIDEINLEFWKSKIIMSCLENVVNNSTSALPEDLVQTIKATLLNMEGDLDAANPFFRDMDSGVSEKSSLGEDMANLNLDFITNSRSAAASVSGTSYRVGNNSTVNNKNSKSSYAVKQLFASSDTKIALRTLVEAEIMKLAKNVVNIYAPVLDQEAMQDSSDAEKVRKGLVGVNKYLTSMARTSESLVNNGEKASQNLEKELNALGKHTDQCTKAIREFDKIVREANDPDEIADYMNQLRKEKERISLELEIAELTQIIDANPPVLSESLKVATDRLKGEIGKLEKACEAKEQKISVYITLGPQFEQLRMEYQELEEQIKTKLWVKEELEKRSTNNDSE